MDNFSFKVIKAKTKSIQSTPQVRITSAQNHFVLNSVAIDQMGYSAGDFVLVLHNITEDPDARFFITKAVDGEDCAKLGAAGSSLHFNYAGIYGAIYMDEVERSLISIDELIEKGFYGVYTTEQGNKAKRGNKTVTYNLESVGEHDIEGTVREVFALVNRKESLINAEEAEAEAEEAAE